MKMGHGYDWGEERSAVLQAAEKKKGAVEQCEQQHAGGRSQSLLRKSNVRGTGGVVRTTTSLWESVV